MPVSIQAQKRDELGTSKARALRKQGRVPGIIYGHGRKNETITVPVHDIELAVGHGERLLEIDLEGKAQNVLIKEVQYDTFAHGIIHVDLARVKLDDRVKVTVPINLKGTPAGLNEGGSLHQTAAEVTLECLVTAIPEAIDHQVSEMNVGDTVSMRDLALPEGAKLVSDPEATVCSITVIAEEPAEAPEEAEVAEGAEPEVIGEKKEEEGEEAAGAEGGEEK